MSPSLCFHCSKPIPSGQSFYEGRGKQVCLSCFQTCTPCAACKFPEKKLTHHARLGAVCRFCAQENPTHPEGRCHLCNQEILEGERLYQDHQVKVCLRCFNTAQARCFTCRFPAAKFKLPGQGAVCEFCADELVDTHSDTASLLAPLKPFLAAFGHLVFLPPTLVFLDWQVVLGMQREQPPTYPVQFLDELVHWAYPVYHLGQKLYSAVALPPQWFVPLAAGQLVAKDLCQKIGEPHLGKPGAKFHFLRGYVHFLTYFTAQRLGYEQISKKLLRWPESYAGPEFEALIQVLKRQGVPGVNRQVKKRLNQFDSP